MRISDWSSDVCSSDLLENLELGAHIAQPVIDVERGTRGQRAPDHTRRLDRRQFGQAKILANLGAELVLAGYADKLAFTVIGPIVIRTCQTRGMPLPFLAQLRTAVAATVQQYAHHDVLSAHHKQRVTQQ